MAEHVAGASVHLVLPVGSLHRVHNVGDVVPSAEYLLVLAGIGTSREARQFVLPLQIVFHSQHVYLVLSLLEAHIGIVVHSHLTSLTTLGGDEHDTIGTTATVDGGRGSVLQHVDALDVAGRNIGDAADGETVYYIKRCVVAGDRTTTTHADDDLGVGVALRHGDAHTSQLTLHGLNRRSHRHRHEFCVAYRRNRTRHVLALYGSVSDSHHFVKHVGIFLQLDSHLAFLGNDHFLLVTHISDFELFSFRNRDRVITVHIGHYSHRSAGNPYACANNWFTSLVSYLSANGDALRQHS